MSKFEEIKKLVAGKRQPCIFKNEDGEAVIIEGGIAAGEGFFRVTTAQGNGWLRINTYWERGNAEETYRK